jgi:hypothetical protein
LSVGKPGAGINEIKSSFHSENPPEEFQYTEEDAYSDRNQSFIQTYYKKEHLFN